METADSGVETHLMPRRIWRAPAKPVTVTAMFKPYSRSPGLHWCRRWAGLLSLLVLLTGPAQANTSSSDTKDSKYYGNCLVFTEVDMLTDATSHHLACYEGDLIYGTVISMGKMKLSADSSAQLFVSLSMGLQFHMDPHIPVAIRVDKGPLIKRNAHWSLGDGKRALIFDDQLAHQLLHDLARGQRVAIGVGDERGSIRLDGAQRAIADFRQRIGLPAQQTLTPQQRQVLEIPRQ